MTHDAVEKINIPSGDGRDVNAEAAEWAAYLHSGLATAEGQRAFSVWLECNETNRHAYRLIEQWWRDADYATMSDASLREQVPFAQAPHFAASSSAKTPGLRAGIITAMAACLVLGVGLWVNSIYDPVTETYYASRVGEIMPVALSDGSRVTLGGNSTLLARFSNKRRDVELLQGGAYFDVTADADRPFAVRAYSTEIRVLGTAFDVLRSGTDVRVSVVEGSVGVVPVSPALKSELTKGTENGVRLQPGQQVYVAKTGEIGAVNRFDTERLLAWREGRLEYIGVKLSRVVEEVNRYRDVKIWLADPALEDIRVTISLNTHETDRLLSGLELTAPVTISRSDYGVQIKPRK